MKSNLRNMILLILVAALLITGCAPVTVAPGGPDVASRATRRPPTVKMPHPTDDHLRWTRALSGIGFTGVPH